MNSGTPKSVVSLTPKQLHAALLSHLRAFGRSAVAEGANPPHHPVPGAKRAWQESTSEAVFRCAYGQQTLQITLKLESGVNGDDQRVIMFCRRVDPPSSAPSSNTQRGTFNSTHRSDGSFFQKLQLLRKYPEHLRALAVLLPADGTYPRWVGDRILLGDGSARTLLNRFLKATAVIEEIKGTPAAELARRFPDVPLFSAEDIAAATFTEGKLRQVSRAVRERSIKLRKSAVEFYLRQSPDGVLRCFVDGWAPVIPVSSNIVEMHHEDALAGFPQGGREIGFGDAIKFLFPLCPNCHRLLHAKPGGGRYTIPELRALMQRSNRAK